MVWMNASKATVQGEELRMGGNPENVIRKGGEDKYEYKHFVLENGARVVLLRKDDLQKSAVAVSIGVGLYDSPEGFAGLAHLLEHMLFLGSEKYPEENGYREYISKNGGQCNAFTYLDKTVFLHDVLAGSFDESLCIFSEFFKSPLIRKDAVDREVNAVDSEYYMGICLEAYRIQYLHALTRKKGSKLGKTFIGCRDSLCQDDLRDRLYRFWKEEYSAEKFCIVLGGPQSLRELEEYARRHFEGLASGNETDSEEEMEYVQYDEKYMGKLVRLKPFGNSGLKSPDTLVIFISIPETFSTYRKKLGSCILFLLSCRKEGGFVHVMKANGYMSNVDVSISGTGVNTEIAIAMHLLPKGKERISHIRWFLRAYLDVIRRNNCKEVFDLLKEKGKNALKEMGCGSVLDQARSVCMNAHHFPMEDVIIHDTVYDGYDDKLLKDTVDVMLDCGKWIHVYLTDEGEFDLTAKHYGLKYCVSEYDMLEEDEEYRMVVESIRWPLGSAFRDEVGCVDEPVSRLHPSITQGKERPDDRRYEYEELKKEAREYISKNGRGGKILVGGKKMETLEFDENKEWFSCGLRDEHGELRYFINEKHVPNYIVLHVSVESSNSIDDIDRIAKCVLHFSGFSHAFMDKHRHDAFGLGVNMCCLNDGITMTFYAKGPASGVYAFVEAFFKEYNESSTRYDEEYIESSRNIANNNISASSKLPPWSVLGVEVLRKFNGGFGPRRMLESMRKICKDDELVKTSNGYIKFMMSGSGRYSEAVELYGRIRGYITRGKRSMRRIYPIDANGECIGESARIDEVIYADTSDHKDNAVGIYYDLGPGMDKEVFGKAILMSTILGSKFFDEVRTQECMGYIVSMAAELVDNCIMIRYIVQGSMECCDMRKRIERFVVDGRRIIEDLSDAEYGEYVDSTTSKMDEDETDLVMYFNEVLVQSTIGVDLNFSNKVCEAIRRTKKRDVVEFACKDHKKIVVYAPGSEDAVEQ